MALHLEPDSAATEPPRGTSGSVAASTAGAEPDTLPVTDRPSDAGPERSAVARSWERALAVFSAGVLAMVASGPISDNSLLTQIATGRLQASGGLPGTNPFLVTSSDFPVPSWWWSAALGWAERFDGLGAVRFFTVVAAALLGWLIVAVARPSTKPLDAPRNALVQLVPAALVLVILQPWINGRPQLGGFVLLAASLVVWWRRRSPWWMVAIFALWVNVHGSWLYGLAVLGLLWVAECIDKRRLCTSRLRWLAGSAGGVLAGGLFYPERFRLVLLPGEQFGSPEARTAIGLYHEWMRPQLSSPWPWLFGLLLALALHGVLGGRRGAGSRRGSALVVIGLALMGLSAQRTLPVAAVALGAFAADGVLRLTDLGVPPIKLRRLVSAVGVVAIIGAAFSSWLAPHEDLSRYPVEEVDWLADRNLVANDEVKVLHNDWVGNYLEYRFGEEANAWVDDRPSASTMIDYVRLRGLSPGWRRVIEAADPDVVLWQAEDRLPDELAGFPQWRTVLTTDRFRVLCHARIAARCR